MYPDDTQLYSTMDISNEANRSESLAKFNTCISVIKSLFGSNLLKLDDNKMNALILVSSRYYRQYCVCWSCINIIKPVCQEPRVMFIEIISMKRHITRMCKSSFSQLGIIRFFKPHSLAIKSMAHAFIALRIDYGLVTNTHKYNHIKPVLKCIIFIILLITYKAVHGLCPPYICELVPVKQSGHHRLRLDNLSLLKIPKTRLKLY